MTERDAPDETPAEKPEAGPKAVPGGLAAEQPGERDESRPDEAGEAAPEESAGVAEADREPVADGAGLGESAAVVEALLFASSKPVPVERLAEAAELPAEAVERAIAFLEAACASAERGVRIDRVAGGVRLVSRAEFDYPVRRLLGLDGRTKLSMAALETLSIVAYRQPITGPEIAELRGVNSSSSIRTLLDRKLITTAGRKEVVGTPFLYKTTKEFLVHFGLRDLADLPKPEELEAVYGLDQPPAEPAQVELFPSEEPAELAGEAAGEPSAPPEPPSEEPS